MGNFKGAKGWSPFVGCGLEKNCIYCDPSFQRQVKRVGGRFDCEKCMEYLPHTHPERLDTSKIPSAKIIAVNQSGDMADAPPSFVRKEFKVIREHQENQKNHPNAIDKVYFWQSKRPSCFHQYTGEFPPNSRLLTTLETNRSLGYSCVSSAPKPPKRHEEFLSVDFPEKIIVWEPILPYDEWSFIDMILAYQEQGSLVCVYWGFNSKPKECPLAEPPEEKVEHTLEILHSYGVELRGKEKRGITLG